mmetsp:Transcript_42134/g.47947  ORF Transcript_42134/g.47947 Transcript_42134/m.47947 type:complete len:177 (-) Transcript_42134:230-760(-)
MNTTTVLPLEKKDDFVDVELSYQKTHTIATNNNNKNENKRRINKMVLFGGIVALTVGGAVIATFNSKLLTNTNTGDEIAVVSSSYTCKQTSSAPWSGVSYGVAGFDGKYQTCWKNGPNDWQGNCFTNNLYSTSGSSPCLCKPKGKNWQTTSNHRVNRATCGTQCTSVVTLICPYSF